MAVDWAMLKPNRPPQRQLFKLKVKPFIIFLFVLILLETAVTVKRKPAAVHNNNNTPTSASASASALSATSVSPSANKKTKSHPTHLVAVPKVIPVLQLPLPLHLLILKPLCVPFCDEACTCPKTTASIVVKSPKAVTVKKSVGPS